MEDSISPVSRALRIKRVNKLTGCPVNRPAVIRYWLMVIGVGIFDSATEQLNNSTTGNRGMG